MQTLKDALMKSPVLVSLDFSASALGIELGIDASTTVGWGAVYRNIGTMESCILRGMRAGSGQMQNGSMTH
jgi:hypothetical protein